MQGWVQEAPDKKIRPPKAHRADQEEINMTHHMQAHEVEDRAVEYFMKGYNWAETVLLSLAEYLEMDGSEVIKLASGLGGGIGRQGSICGAVTGGVMALGLKYGDNRSADEKGMRKVNYMARELYAFFKEEMGETTCYGLLKCDLFSPEGMKQFKQEKMREEKCSNYVRKTVRHILDLFKDKWQANCLPYDVTY